MDHQDAEENKLLNEAALTNTEPLDSEDVPEESWDNTDEFIKSTNAKVVLNTLAPEISENEKAKRKHKDKLLKWVSVFLGAQFVVIFVLIMTVLIAILKFHDRGNDLSASTIQMLFAFFGTYITSVIVELICILKYIVVNVFDTSISGLMEAFSSVKEK